MRAAASTLKGVNEDFMREALRLARDKMLAGEGGPFGAVVVRGGRIVGRGWNRVTSACDPTAHAEIEALREAARTIGDFRLTGCELYASCEPCPMCLAACYWARLDRVWYSAGRERAAAAGFDDADLYREVAAPPADRRLPLVPLLAEQGDEVFRLWEAKADRIRY